MGGVWMPVMAFNASLSEIVGTRAGIAITREELHEMLSDMPGYDDFVMVDDDQVIRLRSEVIEELVSHLIYKSGRTSQPVSKFFFIDLFHKYEGDAAKTEILKSLAEPFLQWIVEGAQLAEKQGRDQIDPEPIMRRAAKMHGSEGLDVVMELFHGYNNALLVDPWRQVHSKEWKDVIELQGLFKSESLETHYGKFIDQRYIDYLSTNYEKIGDINWRKFEALTAEYFEREGFRVDIGPGRNDDGVDVRVWPKDSQSNSAPLMLVQCKRAKQKICKVVVKSLYADVLHEGAQSGLIVTASRLSPGAEAVCQARSYPIEQANRDTLTQWIGKLRTPGTGIFLGE